MITTGDYLSLCAQAYAAGTFTVLSPSAPSGYGLLLQNPSTQDSQGLEAIAVYNSKIQHLIIAISGSSYYGVNTNLPDFDKDLVNDFTLLRDKMPPQYLFAVDFTNTAISQATMGVVNLTFTGHSLGAALAELCAGEFISKGKYNVNGVTFDGPGTKPMFDVQWPDIENSVHGKILTHLATPNIINTINPQIGTIQQLQYHNANSEYNAVYQLYQEKFSGKVFEQMAFKTGVSEDLNYLYTTHQLVTFQSEMNQETNEFYGEVAAPNWNNDNSRSDIMKILVDSNLFSELFSVPGEEVFTRGYSLVQKAEKGWLDTIIYVTGMENSVIGNALLAGKEWVEGLWE